jgi:hypothetical protein
MCKERRETIGYLKGISITVELGQGIRGFSGKKMEKCWVI